VIQIDIAKHSVSSNETLVQLTNREFDLLCYLVKTKVCTRNQIIEDVWDIHFDYDTGVIDVFINAIRKVKFKNRRRLYKNSSRCGLHCK
jgi:DNA-binding response OmpR family regulator